MHNWDARIEGSNCTLDADWESVQKTCDVLGIEKVYKKNFQSSYWQRVFDPMIEGYTTGKLTPNPDILCNREIKFGELYRWFERETDADMLATGHYARIFDGSLRQSVDLSKDQTYFLAAVDREKWKRVLFPVGGLQKSVVKGELVREAGLKHLLGRKESMGICFVGKRKNFDSFMEQFVDESSGPIVDLETGTEVGQHRGLVHYTVGQAARVGGAGERLYVAEKDVGRNTLLVVSDQKKLNKSEITILEGPVASSVSNYLKSGVRVFCSIRSVDKTGVEISDVSDGLVRLKGEVYAPCAGQWAVFYAEDCDAEIHGRLCLGGSVIV